MAAVRAHFRHIGLAGPTVAQAGQVIDALREAGMLANPIVKFCDQCNVHHDGPVSQRGVDGPDCPVYERLTAEGVDYKDRWETLGRVAKNKIDRLVEQVDAAEALILSRKGWERWGVGHFLYDRQGGTGTGTVFTTVEALDKIRGA
jgi:hypothetical protein